MSLTLANGLPAALSSHIPFFVLDSQFRIQHPSERFARLAGETMELLENRPITSLLSAAQHPATFADRLHNLLAMGQEWRGIAHLQRKDGSFRSLELVVIPGKKLGKDTTEEGDALAIAVDITRVIDAERRRSAGEAKFKALTETIGTSLIVYRGDQTLYANPAAQRLTGYSATELASTTFDSVVHPDYRNTVKEVAAKYLETGDATQWFDTLIVTKLGETRWVEVNVGRIDFDGHSAILATFIDITLRKRAEAAHSRAEAVQAQIVANDPVPTFVINADHVITHWNQACEIISGIPAEEMIGTNKQWLPFYGTERPLMADLILDAAIDAKAEQFYHGKYRRSASIPDAYEAEDFFPHMRNGGRWLYFTAAPLRDLQGKIIGAIETLQDVTDRHLAEQALQQAHKELEKLVDTRTEQLSTVQAQLVQSDKLASIGQLAAGVAHEINNPIGYVQSNISTLEKYINDIFSLLQSFETVTRELPKTDPDVSNLLRQIKILDLDFLREDIPVLVAESKEGISRVRKIIQDLKDFSRVDSTPEWHWSNIHVGIDSTLNIVASELKYKAEIVKEYGNLPDIECLPSELNQVFMNLLVNASHAITKDMGHITIRTAREGNDSVRIEISDDGSGIPPAVLKRIFDPFFTTKAIGKGTGLGLSLSYGIIQKHGGRIEVDSQEGAGSTFRIILPISRPKNLPTEESSQ